MSTDLRAFYACAAFFFIGSLGYHLARYAPVPEIPTLQTLNHKVAVVTCSTSELSHPFDYTVNVCAGKKWKGFGWKMKQLLQYVEATTNDDMIFALLDGKDAFVNRGAFAHDFEKKWKTLDADVVVASEEACSAVDDCYEHMVSYLYPNLSKSKSPFVNSPMCGYRKPLVQVLKAMIRYSGGRDKADDQLAATQIVNGNIDLPAGIRVVHDTHQDLFGSFVHLAKYNKNNPPIHRQRWFRHTQIDTCNDENGKLHVFGCITVGIKTEGNSYIAMKDGLVYDMRENCDVKRSYSLLGKVPVFWHGNGPGRFVYNKMQEKRLRCLATNH